MSDLVKATFTPESASGAFTGNGFTVQFNPTDIQLNAKATWQAQNEQGAKTKLEFKRVDPRTLTMTLIFDTSTNNADVRKVYVNRLMDVFRIDSYRDRNPAHEEGGQGTASRQPKERNPVVMFEWADFTFEGALTGLDTKFTMFSAGGYPIRAEVKVTMLEYTSKDSFQIGGPTSDITIPQVKLTQLQSGQTLSHLASMLGTSAGALAAFNNISDPMDVSAGTVLQVPTT